jgi:hypothetical protein
MKIKVEFTVEVSEEDWHLNFGTETQAQVREDVKERARYLFVSQCEADGVRAR